MLVVDVRVTVCRGHIHVSLMVPCRCHGWSRRSGSSVEYSTGSVPNVCRISLARVDAPVACRERLGGLLKYYYREAA